MRKLAAAAVIAVVGVVGQVGVPTATSSVTSRAVETCHGRPATVTPDQAGNLVGTPGPDVIVVDGQLLVRSGEGDDLICVVGTAAAPYDTEVDAGPGDDVVDASTSPARVLATLGLGDDHFVGSSAGDVVRDGPEPSQVADPSAQDGTDLIDSRGGDDSIFVGETGSPRPDVVRSGAGSDSIDLPGLSPGLRLDVGAGAYDRVTLGDADTSDVTWRVDARRHRIDRGVAVWSWTGRIDIYVFVLDRDMTRLAFVGTDAKEQAYFESRGGDLYPVTARTGGGRDRVGVAMLAGRARLRLDGGRGRDTLTLSADGVSRIRLDLQHPRLDYGPDDAAPGSVAAFEDVNVWSEAARVTVTGGPAPESFEVYACGGGVSAGPGDDRVRLRTYRTCTTRSFRAYGGVGDDRLNGARDDDLLVGGRGLDRANGRGGSDTCIAEVVTHCEAG